MSKISKKDPLQQDCEGFLDRFLKEKDFPMAMQLISENTLYSFLQISERSVLEYHAQRPKVIETKKNTIVKLFHPKNWCSSNTIKPYALRFTKNAGQLAKMGFVVPEITQFSYCPTLKIYLVEYHKIQGDDLGVLMKRGKLDLLTEVLEFVAMLHARGIFFRAIHLSNLLYQGSNKFALIDITDLQIKSKPLSIFGRYRNLKHLFSNKTDKPYWLNLGFDKALDHYTHCAKLSPLKNRIIRKLLQPTISPV